MALVVALASVVAACAGGAGSSVDANPGAGVPEASDAADAPASTAVREQQPGATVPRTEATDPVVVTPYVAEYFTASVLEGRHARRDVLQRWERDLTVGTEGRPTAADLAILDQTLGFLALLVPHELRRDDRHPDVTVHFAPRTDWAEILDDPDVGDDAGGWTYTYTAGSSGALSRAVVVVDSELPQSIRHRVVAHELGHAVGLGHGPCPGTLMHEGGEGASPLWIPTALDAEMLRLLYEPRFRAGMAVDEVRARLSPTAADGPVCDEVRWYLVEHDDDYLCSAGDGSRPCVRFDGTAPSWPPERPDRWIVDGLMAEYDPDVFDEYRFEDRRLLCERTAAAFDPCVEWSGPPVPVVPLARPDWFTDGTHARREPPAS